MKKFFAIFLVFALLLPAFATAGLADPGYNQGLGDDDGTLDGVDIEISSVGEKYKVTLNDSVLNTTSNYLSFDFDIQEVDGSETVQVITTTDASGKKIDATNGIVNYRIGNIKSGVGFNVTLNINNGSDSVEIPFIYYNLNNPGAKFITNFSSKIEVFDKSVSLNFPNNTFLVNTNQTSAIAPTQAVVFNVQSKPSAVNSLQFISNVYQITDSNGSTGVTKPSRPGKITLSYDANLSSSIARHNVAISKKVNGDWVPVGGYVDSRRNTVETTISELGTYAVTLNYQTWGYQDTNWSFPYVMGLAYKGIILPEKGMPTVDTSTSALFTAGLRTTNISRLDFSVISVRSLGLQPVKYDNHFGDLVENFKMTTLDVKDFSTTTTSPDSVALDHVKSVKFEKVDVSGSDHDVITIEFTNDYSTPAGVSAQIIASVGNVTSFGTLAAPTEVSGSTVKISLYPDSHTLKTGDTFTIGPVVTLGTGTPTAYKYDVLGYIAAAVENGILLGVGTDSNGKNILNPGGELTREQAAVFVARMMNLRTGDIGNIETINRGLARYYKDVADISPWARPEVEAASKAGIINGIKSGDDTNFKPQDRLTIEQATTMIYRVMENQKLFGR